MEKLKLFEPTMEHAEAIWDLKCEYERDTNSFRDDGIDCFLPFTPSGEIFVELYLDRKITPTVYLCVRETDGKVIGIIDFWHHINNQTPTKIRGHFGYYVRPSERNKGYGTKLLSLCLERAKESGLDKVLVTCQPANMASKKVIQANGGVLEKVVIDENKKIEWYWITL